MDSTRSRSGSGCTVMICIEGPGACTDFDIFGAMENLSETGLRLIAGGELEVDDQVQLRFCLTRQSEEIRLRARVVWRRHYIEVLDEGKVPSMALGGMEIPTAFAYGLAFIDVHETARRRLREFVGADEGSSPSPSGACETPRDSGEVELVTPPEIGMW